MKRKKNSGVCNSKQLYYMLFVILRISIYEMPDNGFAIIMRAGISLAGC